MLPQGVCAKLPLFRLGLLSPQVPRILFSVRLVLLAVFGNIGKVEVKNLSGH